MKHLQLITILAIGSLAASAAVPLHWTVETSRAVPAQFEAYQGETLALEAALQSYGKPLEAPSNYSLYWQTNGMGSAYWSTNISNVSNLSNPSNILRATWRPEYDVGAKVYNCFIGVPGTIYHAAFQLRLRPSPGATPNVLPLPVPVIDFAKVRVLNPPWSGGGGGGGGVDTNAVIDIIHKTVDGSARTLPPYLHYMEMDDTYPDAAAEWYAQADYSHGSCSSVRDGGFLYRNYDWNFDFMPEFVIRCVATASSPSCPSGRFASLAVCNVGTNLTEADVVSGKWSRWYKALPGHAVDGINENGVACNINVVDGAPQWDGGVSPALHPLAAVRWILDHAANAQHAAEYIASHIAFPAGLTQNFHYMIADETSTYIVENGSARPVPSRPSATVADNPVLTNFRLYPSRDTTGEGQERYDALASGANITSQWWTITYTASGYRASDLPGITGSDLTSLFNYWASKPREAHRGETFRSTTTTSDSDYNWWQTVHTSVYDISNRVLRVAAQETDDWYTFSMRSDGVPSVDSDKVREIVHPLIGAATNAIGAVKRDKADRAVYQVTRTENTDWTWTSEDHPELAVRLNESHSTPGYGYEPGKWWVDPLPTRISPTYPVPAERGETSITFIFDYLTESGDLVMFVATATRPRYMDESPVPSTNAVLAAVVTNGTGKVTEGDIVKLGANGRLVKATAEDIPELPYLSTENGGEVEGVATFKSDVNVRGDLNIDDGGTVWADGDVKCDAGSGFSHSLRSKADRATTLFGYGITDARGREDNTCHNTELSDTVFTPSSAIPSSWTSWTLVYDNSFWQLIVNGTNCASYNGSASSAVLTFAGGDPAYEPYPETFTRVSICTEDEKFTTPTYVDVKVSSAVSTNNPAFVSAVRGISPHPSPTLRLYDEVRHCWWIGRIVNGVINWEVE